MHLNLNAFLLTYCKPVAHRVTWQQVDFWYSSHGTTPVEKSFSNRPGRLELIGGFGVAIVQGRSTGRVTCIHRRSFIIKTPLPLFLHLILSSSPNKLTPNKSTTMFRLALLSSLFAVATARKLGAIAQFERAMQGLDLDAFQFNFAGININAELAQAECPNQWGPTVSCVIGKCPQFLEVCPDLNIPEEYEGTVRKLI